MNKKVWIVLAIVAAVVVLLCVTVGVMSSRSLGISTGRFLRAEHGAAMMVCDNSPISLSNQTNRDLFDGLETGDKILVLHDGIAESYPGQTGAYAVIRLKKGSIADIPQGVLESLRDLGWLTRENSAVEEKGSVNAENEPFLDLNELDIAVSYVPWIDDPSFRDLALNTREEAPATSVMETVDRLWSRRLPLFKFDTWEELEQFRQHDTVRERSSFSYDEVSSFDETCARYDAAFFENHTLLLVYIGEGSGSYRFGVKNIPCDGESLCVRIEHLNHPAVQTCDMAGWFITVAVPDSIVVDICTFDAEFACDCP